MSGVTGDNPYRASGVIAAAAAAGGLSWQDIETGATMTAEAGNGYWIDTTSNACTITLPSSADNGDEIMFADYDRTWGTNGIIIDSNGLNYQGDDDSFDVEYGTDGTALHIVYSGATNGWIPTLDKTVEDVPSKGNQNGIFAYGAPNGVVNMSNLVSNVGVVGSDVTGVGTARQALAACEYGGDKGIFAFGSPYTSVSNLVTNAGVVGTDVTGVGTNRSSCKACDYGDDKGIFAFGWTGSATAVSNLVSNVGVVATDVTGVGTARRQVGACEYGGDKGIMAYGLHAHAEFSISNLVSNVGVMATDTTGVGTARSNLAACRYGTETGIFGFGSPNYSNLVSTVGVISTDVTGVGTTRTGIAACEYGGDKAIFGFGIVSGPSYVGMTNLVSNAGVIATDVTAVGTGRIGPAGLSYN